MISDEGWGTYPTNTRERGVAVPPRRPDAWATQDFDDEDAGAPLGPYGAEPSGSIEAPLLGQRMRPSRHLIEDLDVAKPAGSPAGEVRAVIGEPPPTDDVRTTTPPSVGSTLAAAPAEVLEPPAPTMDRGAHDRPVGAIGTNDLATDIDASATIRLARARARRSWVLGALLALAAPLALVGLVFVADRATSADVEPRLPRTVDSTKHALVVGDNTLARRGTPAARPQAGPKAKRQSPMRAVLRVRK